MIGEKQLVADFTDVMDATCSGADGSAVITVTTGAGNYEYSLDNQISWNAFISGSTIQIPAGTDYTIFVRDNSGEYCPTLSGLITISDPSGIVYTVGTITESVPERASGKIDFLSISGGSPGYVMDIQLVSPTAPGQYQPQIYDLQGITIPGDGSGNYFMLLEDLYAGIYQIFIRDNNNCEIEVLSSADQMLEVPLDNSLFIPNVFTPNGDGVNDFFFIRNMSEEFPTSIIVTNRWGKTIYENFNYQNDWDAEGLADGIYYYTVQLNGTGSNGWVEVWRGTR